MTTKRLLAAVFLALTPVAAAAQSPAVDSARAQGLVGERFDGFLGYAVTPSSILRSQVEAINIRRRALYTNFARQRGVSPYEVQITAGCQLLLRVEVGEVYLLSDGRWRRRAAGQPMVMPDYCD